jgi:hypothetical protein
MTAAVLSLTAAPGDGFVASGIFTGRIVRWTGTSWASLGAGINAQALVLRYLPSGDLMAGGHFTFAGGAPANRIARWDGTAWSALGDGADAYVMGLEALPSGDLIVGGGFASAGGSPADRIGRWGCPPVAPCYPDCNADRSLTIADFGCFQAKFVTGDPYADCNASGSLTIADFGCFQAKFAAGCP